MAWLFLRNPTFSWLLGDSSGESPETGQDGGEKEREDGSLRRQV